MVFGFPFSSVRGGSSNLRLVVGPNAAVKGLRLDLPHLQVRRPLPLLLVSAESSLDSPQTAHAFVRGSISSAFLRFLSRNPASSGEATHAAALWSKRREEEPSPWVPHSSCKAWVCTSVRHMVLAQPWGQEGTWRESTLNLLRLFAASPASLVAVAGSTLLSPGQFAVEAGGSGGGERGCPALCELEQTVGSGAFLILRFGLGKPREPALLEGFKRERFSEKEALLLERKTFPEASELIQRVLVGDAFASRDKLRFRCDYPLQEGKKPKGGDSKAGRCKKNFLNRVQRHLR